MCISTGESGFERVAVFVEAEKGALVDDDDRYDEHAEPAEHLLFDSRFVDVENLERGAGFLKKPDGRAASGRVHPAIDLNLRRDYGLASSSDTSEASAGF